MVHAVNIIVDGGLIQLSVGLANKNQCGFHTYLRISSTLLFIIVAMRSSSIRYLNAESQIGLATYIITLSFVYALNVCLFAKIQYFIQRRPNCMNHFSNGLLSLGYRKIYQRSRFHNIAPPITLTG